MGVERHRTPRAHPSPTRAHRLARRARLFLIPTHRTPSLARPGADRRRKAGADMSTPAPAVMGRPPSPCPKSPQRVRVLPQDEGAAATARDFAREGLQGLGLPRDRGLHDDVASVVTELVANAVTHGATGSGPLPVLAGAPSPIRSESPVMIRFGLIPGALLVEVQDASPAPPRPGVPATLQEGGRGLLLVGALTWQWGWYALEASAGKVVWATFALATT
ncbi:ATP-binding protein [Actinomadura sp. NPDC023710]|uniref:ATP-binding protein n=1 Tax=Actinomadura sp. NPDC023710 TaxID=3158219 RepID=UPI0033F054E1